MSDCCTLIQSHSKIQVEENGMKACFNNLERLNYTVTKVDGCLITKGRRCDYLVSKTNIASVLVELKGKSVEHAINQLLESISHPKVKPLLNSKIGCLIIASQSPSFNRFIREAQTKFARHKSGLTIRTKKGEFNILDLTKIAQPRKNNNAK